MSIPWRRWAEIAAVVGIVGGVAYWGGDLSSRVATAEITLSKINVDAILLATDKAIQTINATSPARPGILLQMKQNSTNEHISSDRIIPYDQTRPKSSEGLRLLDIAIKPKVAKGRYVVEAIVYGVERNNRGDNFTVALFRDDETEAFASATNYMGLYEADYAGMRPVIVKHVLPHSGESHSFIVRVGMNDGLVDINGGKGVSQLGGSVYSSISVKELLPQ